ncbi:organic solvent tolerance protein OstA [Virgibacillus sp. AGTR]|uniref:organic solvent tolerance protein OstA n=1 Tax=Virgibacillus sp. AGTR TaxID=2812055 RepID=UPI001D162C22|nr:organic solvent tolerance protein OstA [Virgibacillus sp. AGTR]MCC2248834.1 organic solvent tolerance protein OstA [Virgibacillus sp. AGTR]
MAVKELNAKEQHYADTRDEAEELVAEAKEDIYLISFQISEKHNKYGTYFLVDLKFSYDTPKEIMENAGSKREDEPEEVHEGVEYNVNPDGTASVKNEENPE